MPLADQTVEARHVNMICIVPAASGTDAPICLISEITATGFVGQRTLDCLAAFA